ncbi:oxidoreductase [Nocardia sp. JMUB6875]|uniref:SDR family oxidoreductase n=1 Tax=Nocardia sp. JMUB6875 TaxID=3158170 RepID=UPI0032E77D01
MLPNSALITGCSSGIGRATALALAAAGIPTYATARNPESIADLAESGSRVLQLDVTDPESCARAVRSVEEEHGSVGVLVNNAGYSQVGPVEEVPMDELYRQFDTNVFGVVRLTRLVLPAMRGHGGGRIITLGSAAGLVAPPASAAYSMTKYALEALCDSLRLEVHHFGVRAVLIEPGAVRTRFIETGQRGLPQPNSDHAYDHLRSNLGTLIERTHRDGARGILTSETVARVVARAALARNPKPRYKIGAQARIMPIARRLLGDRLWDRAMHRLVPAE